MHGWQRKERKMDSYCEGKVAVVTGAGGTLCSAIAVDLAKKGGTCPGLQ